MKHSVLLAEDDESIAKLVMFKLGKIDAESSWAKNGKEAIEFMGKRPFSLVLLDVMMPEKDGWQVLEAIRAQDKEKSRRTVVLMLTARAQEDEDSVARRGADGLIKKPFDPAVLAERVEMALLRIDFVATFPERISGLEKAVRQFEEDPTEKKALIEIKAIVHRVAGTGASYGFENLSKSFLEFDSWIEGRVTAESPLSPADQSHVLSRARGCLEMLKREQGS